MKESCHYCKQLSEVVDFEHPLTFQIHPTCDVCKNKLLSTKTYEIERNLLSKVGCLSIFMTVALLIIYFVYNSTISVYILIISVVIGLFSFFGLEYFVKKRNKNFGFDPTKYKWCNTCRYFKRVKNWDFEFSESKDIVDSSFIPCKNYELTQKVWNRYFKMLPEDRKLYPDFCEHWIKK